MATLYDKVETLRKEKGISQRALEIELGFSNGYISKWKKSMPTIDRIQKLADYFNVPVEYLTDTGLTKIVNAYNTRIIKEQEEADARVKELFDLYEKATPETQETIIAFLKASLRKS